MQKVIVVGNGKLADAIRDGLPGLKDFAVERWENAPRYDGASAVVVHVGSGRQIDEVIAYCASRKVPLIQGATGIEFHYRDSYRFPLVNAPNFNILMIKFMHMLKKQGSIFKGYRISVEESHQASKKTTPGTAFEIAGALGVSPAEIASVREEKTQSNRYGIPAEHLKRHAVHQVTISDGGDAKIFMRTEVFGLEPYVRGLAEIIGCAIKLENRVYDVFDLIESGIL